MRYINNYNYNTLIIIDSKNNETVGKVLLDIEDIPKVQKYHWRLNEKGYVIASIKGHKTIGYFNTEEEAKQARSLYCENQ